MSQLMEGRARIKKQKVTISDARPIIEQIEIEKLFSAEVIQKKAIKSVEQNGIPLFFFSSSDTVSHFLQLT